MIYDSKEKRMKKITLLCSSISLALFLSACGGNGDGQFDTGGGED